MEDTKFVSYQKETYESLEMLERSQNFYNFMDKRRSVRQFSDRAIDKKVIEQLIVTASTAPSGAQKLVILWYLILLYQNRKEKQWLPLK